ncbi:hypothetical protein A3D05_03405 [Candidatus Gottesmanbacteria bacterium RIFCSPHIGHO2_02_FULL_40_24]|uniref:Uncharacterized protein n=1 Tax=Candidatus Gottesmanbacteria bacterium RIFCSPHIGHO2_01_FULL_40_15 TaxID=1798376 RepID=A0A1F5Z0W7_9BACT|nr:MAG: hypothetical protein A2777_02530 [Candidatus Gottesmanbacteria bacterium RIFCSPHIGHO2_01_FULL_40_15]OGG17880.1 MAG: hypothetical protein A3D05_03405 [Candidatus Gottesmanbacteria bacterium RIFCSPHIGHO2_02_FULL_40_24]OGG21747.1 MAG: hypothetical protein A3B48_03555 [Candidatus Gottesmanbacteria bacterium RIFCSPLOWO2_01_FULL_40_10]OGG24721.1 MAG: hypothetical protein A3E42_01585 [Candidatus Gottesmanbacteria bacterium RIFCSPHIGHO2_12_FULL_40_13]OGG31999.1 MAG: hypothetical protein A3I80_0
MAGEKIVWVGSYPRVVGVNDPHQAVPGIEISEHDDVELPVQEVRSGIVFSHDLRAGHVSSASTPKPTT